MARTFYTSTDASDLSSGGNFSNALTDNQQAVNSIVLTAPQASTATGSYFTASGVPGTDGTSTGTFTFRTNITASNAGINFRINLMRVNSAGTVQATVLGTYAAASTGTRTQDFVNPALGTWASGDRLRAQYDIQNTNAHGGDKGITFETGQLAQDTPFAAPPNPISVTPTTASLATATFAPTVTVASASTTVTPTPASLTLTAFAPTATGDLPDSYATDTFARSVTDGWGAAVVGGAWTVGGTAADYDVAGGEGQQVLGAVSVNRNALLNSVQLTGDLDATVDWGFSGTAGGSSVFGWIGLRRQEADTTITGTFYNIRWQIATNGAMQILHNRYLAGVSTFLGSGLTITGTFDNTKRYRLRTLIETAAGVVRIRSKMWEVGTGEPASWQKDDSDTPADAYLEGTSPGTVMLRGQNGATSSTGTVYYDNLNVAAPASGTTVTPTTASLTTATFAPTVSSTAHQTVTPGVASLTISSFAPVVGLTVTPTTAALSTATFAPSVAVTNHQTVTPTTATLATATFAPAVATTAHQTVTPTTVALTTATFAPTVTATTGSSVTVTPTTASLTTALFAPTVAATADQTVTPSTAALTATTFAPSVSATAHQTLTPSTASLSTARFAPSVAATAHQVATPATAALTTSTLAPVVAATAHQTLTPNAASLATARFAPSISVTDAQAIVPAAASLSLTAFAPNVSATAHQAVTPTTVALTTARFAPTATTTAHVSVVPSTASLTTARFAPSVQAGDAQSIVPGAANLSLTTFAPTVTAPNPITVTPAVASLTLTPLAPTVLAGVSAVPATASLTLATFAPTVALTYHQLAVPSPASLSLTVYIPSVVTSGHQTLIPTTAALVLTAYAPSSFIGYQITQGRISISDRSRNSVSVGTALVASASTSISDRSGTTLVIDDD